MGLRWSMRLGHVAGIPLRVHWTFGLLLLWVVLRDMSNPRGWWLEAAYGLTLVLSLFVCVVLHELGHSLAAQRLGIAVRDITLLPIGGVARMEVWPGRIRPWDELRIALAGPAMNVALALLLWPLAWAASQSAWAGPAGLLGELPRAGLVGYIGSLWLSNIFLALFNLLPIFPMDGGRVLRALLALRGDYLRATWLAVLLAHVLAMGLVGLGLWTASLMPIGLSLVLVVGAGREYVQARRLSADDSANVNPET